MSTESPVRVAFLMLSDEPARAMPGLVLAARMKAARGADVRVLFFGPGVKLAAGGTVDEQLEALREAEVPTTVCAANVDQFGVGPEVAERGLTRLSAGAEVEEFARQGYTVLTF